MTTSEGQSRSRNYLNQLKGSVVFKGLAVLASFLVIPLMITYLGKERFGIWSTLLTIMSWVILFDLGIGNGLRNRVAEALAEGRQDDARDYISAGYSLIGLIALLVLVAFEILSFFVVWQEIFNTASVPENELRLTVQIAGAFIIVNFWIGLIASLLGAVQKSSLLAVGQFITQGLILVFVYLVHETTDSALTTLALIYGVSVITSNSVLTFWFFKKNPLLFPRFKFSNRYVSRIMGLGVQFFIIQIAVLIIFMTDKMLITQLIGPAQVTEYEVVFKLFSVITFAHSLISMPLWSAYTESFKKNDFLWITAMMKKQLFIYGGLVMIALVLAAVARTIIAAWIDTPLTVPDNLIAMMLVLVLITTWNNIFAMFINGTGLIKPQLYTSVFAMILNIPLSIYFVTVLEMGTNGVVLGTVISLLGAAIVLPTQTIFLIKKHNLQSRP